MLGGGAVQEGFGFVRVSGSVWGSGSHRWLSRAQLVGVDLEFDLFNKEVE